MNTRLVMITLFRIGNGALFTLTPLYWGVSDSLFLHSLLQNKCQFCFEKTRDGPTLTCAVKVIE